jgi:pimeloyl-ACP methyl ester carboxylesterase
VSRIVYLHGFASGPGSGKARFFRRYLEARGATVEIPDLAEGDFEHLTITGQLAVIERTMAGDAVPLIGSSMGGYLAALYAARHPEVPRVVLLAPAFGFAHRWQERLGPERMAEWRATGTTDVYHYAEGRNRPLAPGLIDDGARYPDYPDVHQPALIFHGSRDDVVPAEYSRAFATTHRNASLEILDSGHELTDVLDYMAPKVAAFLGLGPV